MTRVLEIVPPDDWHLHLRDDALLRAVVPHTAKRFRRAIVMPNLTPPVTTVAAAHAYRERILAALPVDTAFEPLMTLYLTDNTAPSEIRAAAADPHIHGVKLYPAGATTNSDSGVTDLARCWPALEAMADTGLPLLVHGEVTRADVDVFDRERCFIEETLAPVAERLSSLRIVLEHITTRDAVEWVRSARDGVAATITPQHLALNRNALFQGGLRPHLYCLPVLKAEGHRRAVADAAFSGDRRFFLGTDSAPHLRRDKESACGCAGIYSAPAGLELYVQAFDEAGALDRFEAFASLNGPRFYGLPPNAGRMRLEERPWRLPAAIPAGDDELVPFRAGEELRWAITGIASR
jgi:dihydroorotase